jgi:hypothetical protein
VSVQIWKNCKLYLAGYDLSGDHNELGLSYQCDIKDVTTFGRASKAKLAGLKSFVGNHKGLWNDAATGVDKVLFDNLALADQVMTLFGVSGAEGEVAYSGKSVQGLYSPGAKIGDLLAFTVKIEGTGDLIQSTCLKNGTVTATGNGTAYNLGAVSSSQKLYAALHIIAVSGSTPSLTVKIQSDDAQAFSTPTDRITFNAMTAIGAQWATPVAGPITDTWWRANWTVSGSTPSFTVVVVVGIQ